MPDIPPRTVSIVPADCESVPALLSVMPRLKLNVPVVASVPPESVIVPELARLSDDETSSVPAEMIVPPV